MIDVQVSDLIKHVKGNLIIGDPRLPIKRVSIDTRTMERGDFFLALKGEKFDAHDFLSTTLEKGAAGLIVEKLDKNFGKNPLNYRHFPTIVMVQDTLVTLQGLARMYRERFYPTVIGITGTNGKTATKEILAYIISQVDRCLYSKANYNNHIGLPLTLLNLEPDHTCVVVEMGAAARGDIHRLADIAKPKMGVITNIAPAHLITFGNIENIFQTKMELLDSLPEDGEAIVNADDQYLAAIKERLNCRVTTFGLRASYDVWADRIEVGTRTAFRLNIKGSSYPVQLSYTGLFNVYNALAAAAAAWRFGIEPEVIVSGLHNSRLLSMRNEVISSAKHGIVVHDAYNANPSSMRASLTSFVKSYPKHKKIAVLGDMLELGKFSEQEHRSLGEFLASLPLEEIKVLGSYRGFVREGAFLAGMKHEKLKSYDNSTYLLEDLKKRADDSTAIFFKASRAMAFEKIIEQLIK